MFKFYLIALSLLNCGQTKKFPTIDSYIFNQKPNHSYKLSKKLKEASGLAIDASDRLFSHNDEFATIYQIDIKNGEIIKQFNVGDPDILKGDFEGLAIVDSNFYLVKSNGDLIEFKEGEANQAVAYKIYKSNLSKKIEIEGLCYDPNRKSLLLAVKLDSRSKSKDSRSIFEFSILTKQFFEMPRFKLSQKEITGINVVGIEFGPSGIEYNKKNNHFYIIAHLGKIIVEIDTTGQIVAVDKLLHHKQPEGITFLSDGTCLIIDEGKNTGQLSFYRSKN